MIDLTNSGYEFCTARMAENWVKYESGQFFDGNRPGGESKRIRTEKK